MFFIFFAIIFCTPSKVFFLKTENKNDNIDIMNDLFELITKHKFIDEVSKMKSYGQLEQYFKEVVK